MEVGNPIFISLTVGIALLSVLAWALSRRLQRKPPARREQAEAIDAAAQAPALNTRLRETARQIRDGEFDASDLDAPD
jgi:hypothetical protein